MAPHSVDPANVFRSESDHETRFDVYIDTISQVKWSLYSPGYVCPSCLFDIHRQRTVTAQWVGQQLIAKIVGGLL